MENEQKGDGQKETGQQQAPPTPTPPPTPAPLVPERKEAIETSTDPKGGSAGSSSQQPPKTKWQRFKAWVWPMDFNNFVMIFLTCVIAFGTLVSAGAIVMQWREMVSGSDQTDRIICADNRIAAAMENSVGQAQQSLDASIDASHTDQRAWVAAVSIGGVPELGKQWIVTIKGKNTGKTFAKKFRMTTSVSRVAPPRTEPDFTERPVTDKSISILAPNGEYTSTATVTGDPNAPYPLANPTQDDLNSIRSEKVSFFAYGEMEYSDVFQVVHWTKFCFHLTRQMAWESCSIHNDTDNNPETQETK